MKIFEGMIEALKNILDEEIVNVETQEVNITGFECTLTDVTFDLNRGILNGYQADADGYAIEFDLNGLFYTVSIVRYCESGKLKKGAIYLNIQNEEDYFGGKFLKIEDSSRLN